MSLSAADWTRLQRRRAGTRYVSESNANKADTHPQRPYGVPLLIPKDAGVSKIQRTASDWTNSVDASVADYFTKSTSPNNATVLTLNRLCDCSKTAVFRTKVGVCSKCNLAQHVRIN